MKTIVKTSIRTFLMVFISMITQTILAQLSNASEHISQANLAPGMTTAERPAISDQLQARIAFRKHWFL